MRRSEWRTGAPKGGAALCSYSHVVLDSIMHDYIRPFAPFSDASSLLRVLSLSTLQWFCVATGIVGPIIVAIRSHRA